MRFAVEALAADFGGIRTYVENLLRGWATAFPDDDVLVLTKAGTDLDVAGHGRREVPVGRPDIARRPLAQTRAVPRLVADHGAAAMLSVMPATGLLRTPFPRAVVVHDLRHELRPEEFSRGRRLVRRVSYTRGYRLADALVCVSQRTADDLRRLHPGTAGTPVRVVPHGADHALRWGTPSYDGPALAFGHHTNKRPDLVVAAWAEGRRRGLDLPPLRVLGVSDELRPSLAAQVAAGGLGDVVRLDGYVRDDELRAAVLATSLLVLPSTFEGFGIPIVEAMALGVPVVVGPDPGSVETAAGHAAVMTGWTATALLDAVRAATAFDADHRERARGYAASLTWERSARSTRELLVSLLPEAGALDEA